MPCVSVVTCTYNRAHLIGETIRSVLDQTFQDFEYIIVDDGSSDRTEDVIRQFKDQRIQYYHLPHTGRLSHLRNFSHSKCSGEFIAYVDSDDIWNRSKLEKQVSALRENPAAGFSFSDIEIFDSHGILKASLYKKQGIFQGNVFRLMLGNELVICHTTLLIRRSCVDVVGQSDENFHAGDHDFVFRMSKDFDAVIFYEPLVRVRKHDQNSTNNVAYDLMGCAEHHMTLRKLLETNVISLKEYRHAIQLTSYTFGALLAKARQYEAGLHYLWKSFRLKPWDPRISYKILQALSKKILSV